MSRETATEKEHARNELLRQHTAMSAEVRRLKHALSSANTRAKRLRGLYRVANARAVGAEQAHRAALADVERLAKAADADAASRQTAWANADAAHEAWRAANLRAVVAEAAACAWRRCPCRRTP